MGVRVIRPGLHDEVRLAVALGRCFVRVMVVRVRLMFVVRVRRPLVGVTEGVRRAVGPGGHAEMRGAHRCLGDGASGDFHGSESELRGERREFGRSHQPGIHKRGREHVAGDTSDAVQEKYSAHRELAPAARTARTT